MVLRVCVANPHNKEPSSEGHDKHDNDKEGNDDDDNRNNTNSRCKRGESRYRGQCFECGEHGHCAKYCNVKKEMTLLADINNEPMLLQVGRMGVL